MVILYLSIGVFLYEKTQKDKKKEKQLHNTVKIGDKDQTQVWGGFRVAKRAKITNLIEKNNLVEASHDGYLINGYKHTRSLSGERNV